MRAPSPSRVHERRAAARVVESARRCALTRTRRSAAARLARSCRSVNGLVEGCNPADARALSAGDEVRLGEVDAIRLHGAGSLARRVRVDRVRGPDAASARDRRVLRCVSARAFRASSDKAAVSYVSGALAARAASRTSHDRSVLALERMSSSRAPATDAVVKPTLVLTTAARMLRPLSPNKEWRR